MIQYSYSCMSRILTLTIILFMISILFLLFSLYHYSKYNRIEGKLTGVKNSACSTDLYNCLQVTIKDPVNGSNKNVYSKLEINTTYNAGDVYTVFYDISIENISDINSTNSYLEGNAFYFITFFIGILLLLGSILTFALSFPPNYFSYTLINCAQAYA
jgi:hypothetical protein